MKNSNSLLIIALLFLSYTMHSQKSQQSKVEQLTYALNTNVAPNFQLELKRNKAFVKIDSFNKILDIRDTNEIVRDTLSKEGKAKLQNSGRYVGPVFWMYDFQTTANSKVVFRATKRQQIFCSILFKEQDTISLKSKLNAYTSHHKTSDSSLHTVQWTGDKYISLLLTPKWVGDKIKIEVRGITISGKFQKRNQKLIAKNHTKSLRKILRREFEKLFESEEIAKLLSQKIMY